MAQLLKGAPVAAAINEGTRQNAAALKEKGIVPTLAIIRVGERPDDISYENGACRRAEAVGVAVLRFSLSEKVSQKELADTILMLNDDRNVHGVLLLRPLPRHFDEAYLVSLLDPAKDVDGITDISLGSVFLGNRKGFAPCTAQACMEILKYYGIDCAGKDAVVAGRSLVVGRPLAMLLMQKNATVTICHTKTRDLPAQMRRADIVIAAAGQRGAFGNGCFRQGQIVLDVGIHFDENGKMCGDVAAEEAAVAEALTPVPGGVGAVTTAVLMHHVTEAAVCQNT